MGGSIGAFEAKAQVSRLLRAVEQCAHCTITVRGRPVADLVPHRASSSQGGDQRREVTNALLVAERRGVITPASRDLFLARLRSLPISTDGDAAQQGQPRLLALARAHGLCSYDAPYLELGVALSSESPPAFKR